MTVGQRIKNKRLQLGISVDELAAKLGKNRATVYRYEKDDIKDLPITVLEPLANALETTPADLLGWEDNNGSNVTEDSYSNYYLDPETAKVAQELHDDPDLRILFDAARDAKPETLRTAAEMIRVLKKQYE